MSRKKEAIERIVMRAPETFQAMADAEAEKAGLTTPKYLEHVKLIYEES
jgi:hypothetical protein